MFFPQLVVLVWLSTFVQTRPETHYHNVSGSFNNFSNYDLSGKSASAPTTKHAPNDKEQKPKSGNAKDENGSKNSLNFYNSHLSGNNFISGKIELK